MTNAKARILVVDDEFAARDIISSVLKTENLDVELAEDGEEGIRKITGGRFDLVITDLKMPKADGIEVLKHLREHRPDTVGIVATADDSVESAILAMKTGAFDYLTKPFHIDDIRLVVTRALEHHQLRTDNTQLRRELKSQAHMEALVGNHPSIQRLKDLIRTVADSDSTVLVLGDSGTGKELVARAIHQMSDRDDRPLIPVNCGAIPEDLLESELFGHVKGAFTGASIDRPGRFALADGGTIFLDEIGDMSPKLQVKILRVLQEQEFEPVGSTKTLKVNVRVVAATNRDLEKDVVDGRFREDLFYRLNVIPLQLPPLRERTDDIPLLVDHFVAKFNASKGRRISNFSEAAIKTMQRHRWPGNVRELENLVERMAILHQQGVIEVEHLPDRVTGRTSGPADLAAAPSASHTLPTLGAEGVDLNRVVGEFEFRLIQQALERTGGVKNRAAQLLGIKRTTLVEKLKKYDRLFAADPEPVAG